jgi:hypothetical protein
LQLGPGCVAASDLKIGRILFAVFQDEAEDFGE